MTTHIFLQARLQSSRLPRKALQKICGKTIINLIVERLQKVNDVDRLILTTGTKKNNNELIDEAKKLGIDYFCGNEENILDRFYKTSIHYNSENIIRVMADSPLIDYELINKGLKIFFEKKCDILSVDRFPSFPHGLNFQIFTQNTLKSSWMDHFAQFKNEKDFQNTFISPAIYMLEKKKFKNYDLKNDSNLSHLRLTLDYLEDFEVIKRIYDALYPNKKFFVLTDILDFINQNPDIMNINKKFEENNKFSLNIEK